jgi:protein TonB
MRAASYQQSSYSSHASFRSRLTSFLLALAIAALVVLMLIELGVVPSVKLEQDEPITVTVLGGSKKAEVKAVSVKRGSKKASTTTTKTVRTPKVVTPPPKVPPPPIPWNVIPLTKDEFAQSDISTKPTRAATQAPASADAGDNGSDDSSDGANVAPGAGPGGERLYWPDWQRHPTNAELSFYLPKDRQILGWGEIICKTIPDFRVDNCRELGETPGSGLARAVREAAWQFHIKPPRIGGKPQIGVWLRIRIDYTKTSE